MAIANVARQACDAPTRRSVRYLGGRVTWACAAIIGIGLLLRVWLATLPLGGFDGDEATTGLMARAILHGHFYVYMAGQDYNGALEQYLQAVVWAIAPQNIWTLRAVDFGLYVVTAVLTYRVARVYFTVTWKRLAALAFFCLGPYFNVWKGIHSHGSYSIGQVIGVGSLLAAANVSRRPQRQAGQAFALGLMVGLSYWLSWTTFIVVLPAALWAAPTLVNRMRLMGLAILGALIGAAPAIGYAVARGRLPGLGGPQPQRTVPQRLYNFVEPIAREFLGVGYRYGKPGLPTAVQQAALLLVGLVIVVCAARVLRGVIAGHSLMPRHTAPPAAALLYIPFAAAIAFAGSRYAWWTGEPRYLFVAYPVLALSVPAVLGRHLRSAITSWILVSLSLTSTMTTVMTHADDGPPNEEACLTRVATDLEARGITRVYSDYWTGMPLQMVAGNRLTVAPVAGGRAKFPELRHTVDASKPVYYVAGHILDPMDEEIDDVSKVRAALASHHVSAKETPLGGCAVLFSDISPEVRPWQFGVGYPGL